MNFRNALVGLTIGACMCAAMPVRAADDDTVMTGAIGRDERSFYNDSERREAHEKAVAVITAEGYQTELARERVRRFYLVPELGIEIATVGAYLYSAPGTLTAERTKQGVGVAPAFGVQFGWRLGHFNLGARYQGSVFFDSSAVNPSLNLNKAYAEVGFNTRKGAMIFSGFLAGGYAFAITEDTFTNGVGGKAGVSLDFLISRGFTLGPGVSFDVHAYNPAGAGQNWVVAYGGTAFLRIGFQL